MNKLKIIHLNASNFYGGPEKQIVEHLKRLDKNRFDATVVSYLEGGSQSEILQKAEQEGIATQGIVMNGPIDFSALKALKAFLVEKQIDLILSHGYKSTVMGWYLSRKLGIKIVAYSRGYTAENKKVAFYEWLERRVLQKVDGIISVSHGQYQKLENFGIRNSKHWVVHNAVTVNSEAVADDSFEQLFRQQYDIQADAIIGVAAGRLSPEKGHRYFVEAMPSILRNNSRFVAVICGDGPLMETLKNLALKLNVSQNIRFVGFRRDVSKIFSFMDLMVLPSLTEGLPNVVLESFAVKKPVAVTSVGGVPEVVSDGVNGFITPAANPEALAKGVNKLVNDGFLRKSLGEQGFSTVKNLFSFDQQNEKLERIYMEFGNDKFA